MDSEATGDFHATRQAAQQEMLRSLEVIERHYGLDSQLLERVRKAFLHDQPPWVIPLADFLKEAAQKIEER